MEIEEEQENQVPCDAIKKHVLHTLSSTYSICDIYLLIVEGETRTNTVLLYFSGNCTWVFIFLSNLYMYIVTQISLFSAPDISKTGK